MKRIGGMFLLVMLLISGISEGGETVGEGKFFLRVTNVRPDEVRILARIHIMPNSGNPFGWDGKTFYLSKNGEGEIVLPNKPDEPSGQKVPTEGWLAPGESTPWVDIGKYMLLRGDRSSLNYLSPVFCGVLTSPERHGLHVIVEVAQGRGLGLLRQIEVHKPDLKPEGPPIRKPEGSTGGYVEYPWYLGYGKSTRYSPRLPSIGLLVPTRPELGNRVYTLEEALKWQLDLIEEFPDRGRLPKKLIFITCGREEVLAALGYPGSSISDGFPPGIVRAKLGEEIYITEEEAGLKAPLQEQHRRFREYLQENGFDPLDFISNEDLPQAQQVPKDQQWQLVYVRPALHDKPMHYYESANFLYSLWAEELASRTRGFELRHPLKRVLVGANFPPGRNIWPDVRQWVGLFKAKAMTLTWTADWWWKRPEPTPQGYGFLMDAMRLAGSYDNLAMEFYVMPYLPGQSPDNFRRMNSLALAHGAKILNHHHTEPQVMTAGGYIDLMDGPAMYQAIHDLIREVGAVERQLHPAMPQKAKVAVMLSRASDTWDTDDLEGGFDLLSYAQHNVNNHERKALWLALRHAQLPVDLITDDDVAEGLLTPYQVLYMVGSEMISAAVEPLRQWVRSGGILYGSSGGGQLDQYRRPVQAMSELFGLKGRELLRQQRHIDCRETLCDPQTRRLDTLMVDSLDQHTPALEVPALFFRETLVPAAGAQTLGSFQKDHSVGAVINQFGQGRTIYFGALMGLAYLQPAMVESSQIMPTEFPAGLRELITTPVRWAEVKSSIEASDPLVETQLMTTPPPRGKPKEDQPWAIAVLINWRQEPIEELVVRFPSVSREVKYVRSLQQAGFFKGHLDEQGDRGLIEATVENGIPQVRLPLAVTDYLLVY